MVTSTTYTLLLSLPQTATLAPPEKMHCFGNLLVELNGRKVDGTLSGRRYTSKFLVVRLSTSSVVSSGDKAAFPLGELVRSIEGVERRLTFLLLRFLSRLHSNSVIHGNTYDRISKMSVIELTLMHTSLRIQEPMSKEIALHPQRRRLREEYRSRY